MTATTAAPKLSIYERQQRRLAQTKKSVAAQSADGKSIWIVIMEPAAEIYEGDHPPYNVYVEHKHPLGTHNRMWIEYNLSYEDARERATSFWHQLRNTRHGK